MDNRVRSVSSYFLRLIGGVGVILGILGVFSSLPDGNLIGVVLGAVLIAGGVVLLKRSGRIGQAGKPGAA